MDLVRHHRDIQEILRPVMAGLNLCRHIPEPYRTPVQDVLKDAIQLAVDKCVRYVVCMNTLIFNKIIGPGLN